MTPAEQSCLPWIMMAREGAVRTLEESAIPTLADAVRDARRGRAPSLGSPICVVEPIIGMSALAMTMTRTKVTNGGVHVLTVRIVVHPDCLEALGHDPRVREGDRVAETMLLVLERLKAGGIYRTPNDDEPIRDIPDPERIIHSARRMRDRLGAPMTDGEPIDAHAATPLGMGGIHVPRDPSDLERGTLVDVSPDACRPGAVSVRHMDTRHTFTNQTRLTLHVGDQAVTVNAAPIDPMRLLRMERDLARNHDHVRVDRSLSSMKDPEA